MEILKSDILIYGAKYDLVAGYIFSYIGNFTSNCTFEHVEATSKKKKKKKTITKQTVNIFPDTTVYMCNGIPPKFRTFQLGV